MTRRRDVCAADWRPACRAWVRQVVARRLRDCRDGVPAVEAVAVLVAGSGTTVAAVARLVGQRVAGVDAGDETAVTDWLQRLPDTVSWPTVVAASVCLRVDWLRESPEAAYAALCDDYGRLRAGVVDWLAGEVATLAGLAD